MRTIDRSPAGRFLLLPLTASLLLSGTASARLPEPNHVFYGTAIIGIDSRGRITLFNSGAEALLGWTAEQVNGSRFTDLLEPGQEILVQVTARR